MRKLTLWLMILSLCLWGVASGEEDEDLTAWLAAQEAADASQAWADYYGVELDTSTTAQNITRQCKFKVSEGSKDRLTNGKVGSPWKYDHSEAWVGITLPEGVTPGAIRIEWMFDPTGYELIEYDAAQQVLRTRTQADTFPSIYTVYPLDPQTRSIQLKMTVRDQGISNIALYSEGVLPADVQTWLPPVEKADMMVFSTHQDDELIFLGGTIPYSEVVCNRPTITVYMTNCSRDRRREALEGLWEMGCRHYPEFINFKDEKVSSIEKGVKLWGGTENILKEMVLRIRKYKPEVIVTQDLDGEYGHNQHKIMARAVQPAIEAAADPTQYPESYSQYGAWQVKKLYLHLYEENQLRMDWTSPQDAYSGESLLDVVRRGFAKHASQTKYYKIKDRGDYDNALFGLALTTVGEDVMKNDFFENIPRTAEAAVEVAEEAEEVEDAWEDAEPEEVAPETSTPEPTPLPTVAPEPESIEAPGGRGPMIAGIAGTLALLSGAGAWALLRPAKKKKRRRKKKKKKGAKRSTKSRAG